MKSDTMRMVIGFGIVVVILIVWQLMFRPKPRPQARPPAAVPAETAARPEPEPEPSAAVEPGPAAAATAPAFVPDSVVPEQTVTLENDVLRLEFSNVGGVLTSARLGKYDAELVPADGRLLATELLLPSGPVSLDQTPMAVRSSGNSVSFFAQAGSLAVSRTYELGDDYTVAVQTRVTGAPRYAVSLLSGLAVTEAKVKDDLSHFHLYARTEGKVKTFASKNLKEPKAITTAVDWVALKSKYFFLAVIGPDGGFDSTWATRLADERIGFSAVPGATANHGLTVYLGPLEYDRLRSFGLGFEGAVSLGWAKPIALAILWLLKMLFRIFGNWGVAIMLFAVIMKAVFYPLTRIQTRQMRQMQQLQPKIAELKKKYKDDAKTLNQETMQLYRLYKVNPLSGCLPLLVQLPVFWALYSVLRTFIDLRGAGFVLWLKDLSQPDALFGHLPFFGNPPIGLLPVLMGVSFIAQNLLTSTDKKNWALTIIFPIFITVIFLNFPSGLQLYWFTYNILSIVESLIGLRGGKTWLRKKPVREKAPASVAARPS